MENSINITLTQLFQCMAILLSGLVAGLFYGYDCSVVKGLGNLQDDAYLQSFQSINKAIQNPYFFMSFMGALLIFPLAGWLSYNNESAPTFYLLLSASLVYIFGVFCITIFFNVPLNEQLDKFPTLSATENEISAMRKSFENAWNSYHRIRTVAAIISFLLAILSLLKIKI